MPMILGNRVTLTLVAVFGAVLAITLTYLAGDSGSATRITELQQETDSLRGHLAERDRLIAELRSSFQRDLQTTPTHQPSVTTSDLASQVEQLSVTLAKVEDVARNLDQRISRSKLALPTKEEFEAKAVQMGVELEKQQQLYQRRVAEARRVAAQFNVQIDDKVINEYDASNPLPNQPAFVNARNQAIMARRILVTMEMTYASMLLERPAAQ